MLAALTEKGTSKNTIIGVVGAKPLLLAQQNQVAVGSNQAELCCKVLQVTTVL